MICKIVIEEVESGINLMKKCCSFDCFCECSMQVSDSIRQIKANCALIKKKLTRKSLSIR